MTTRCGDSSCRRIPELNGKTPLDAALTEIGGRQVEEIIERGMHGLPV